MDLSLRNRMASDGPKHHFASFAIHNWLVAPERFIYNLSIGIGIHKQN